MKWLIGTSLLFFLLFPPLAEACGGKYPVISARKDDGTQVGLFIPQEQIEKTQAWSPSEGEPPLSISEAYRIVKNWAPKHYSRFDGVNVREISLQTHNCSFGAERWYYVFDLSPVIDGNEFWSTGNWAAVLMDGTIIGAREY